MVRHIKRRSAAIAAVALCLGLTSPTTAATASPRSEHAVSSATQLPGKDVAIKRDSYGVPHVYADTQYDLFYGYGYVLAEDRLFQMEMARRAVLGTSAEVLGHEYIDIDKQTRATFDRDAIQRQIDELSPEELDILTGYADGMNRYITSIKESPQTLMPKQFIDHDFEPAQWTPTDVAMIWIGTMANRFSDGTNEIENLKLLQSLTEEYGEERGSALFDQILWREDTKAPTTQPREDVATPNTLPTPDTPSAAANGTGQNFALARVSPDLKDSSQEAMLTFGASKSFGAIPEASNAWVIGQDKTEGDGSILVNGPQFDWFNPSYVYGIGLHGAGFDVTGNTPFGYPAILFGTNNDISWGSTAGPLDVNDVYQEQLNPDNPLEYWHQGQWKEMGERHELIKVKGAEPVEHTVYSTVHGTVTSIDEGNDTAYAKKRSWTGTEVQSLMAWVGVPKASNWEEYLDQAEDVGISINWYYADKQGNIGYVSPGRLPNRPNTQDPRLPAVGDGSMEWEGFRPFSDNPQTYNPEQGYIANWNNQAGPGAVGDSGNWGAVDRVHEIIEALDSQEKISAEEAWNLIETTSFADLNIRYLRPTLQSATDSDEFDSRRQEDVDLILDWDGQARDDNGDEIFDAPQPAVMRAWLPVLMEEVLADDLPDEVYEKYKQDIYPKPGGSARPASGLKLIYNALLGGQAGAPQEIDFFNGEDGEDVLLRTYLQAIDQLVDEHGEDPSTWEASAPGLEFKYKNFIQVDQASESEAIDTPVYMNRGTENNMVRLNGSSASLCTVAAPGQSGFVAPDGSVTDHYDDQLELFQDFECKEEHLTENDVSDAAVSTLTLASTGEIHEERSADDVEHAGVTSTSQNAWYALVGIGVLLVASLIFIASRRKTGA